MTVFLLCLVSCASHGPRSYYTLRWMESPNKSTFKDIDPDNLSKFEMIQDYHPDMGEAKYKKSVAMIQEGDVLAYYLHKWFARKKIVLGQLNKAGYRILKYGHLAIVVKDPSDAKKLKIFSAQAFKGPNTDDDLSSLKSHAFHLYRLDKHKQLNFSKIDEFVVHCQKKAKKWYGYDFSGMFGLWNSKLDPKKPEDIGHDYICSTVVLAAFQYSGLKLNAVHRKGFLDLITPNQVLLSQGYFTEQEKLEVKAESHE
ncbi:MAG: hypothetical protein MJH11_21060 [Lentisphaeria bacterium]|nr:hypothetical protein [Lentisphaeria bacterium]